jgi:hypothetical protein
MYYTGVAWFVWPWEVQGYSQNSPKVKKKLFLFHSRNAANHAIWDHITIQKQGVHCGEIHIIIIWVTTTPKMQTVRPTEMLVPPPITLNGGVSRKSRCLHRQLFCKLSCNIQRSQRSASEEAEKEEATTAVSLATGRMQTLLSHSPYHTPLWPE